MEWCESDELTGTLLALAHSRCSCQTHATHTSPRQQPSVALVPTVAVIDDGVIHPRLAALGAPSEVRGPSGVVNTSWDRLPAFCMWDLLFCVLCRCRTFYSYSGLSAPDIVALLTTAMPPQGFSGSQGSDGDYHWTGYEQ